jgi:hypothetical protein
MSDRHELRTASDRPNPGVCVDVTGDKAVFHTGSPFEYVATDRVENLDDWR